MHLFKNKMKGLSGSSVVRLTVVALTLVCLVGGASAKPSGTVIDSFEDQDFSGWTAQYGFSSCWTIESSPVYDGSYTAAGGCSDYETLVRDLSSYSGGDIKLGWASYKTANSDIYFGFGQDTEISAEFEIRHDDTIRLYINSNYESTSLNDDEFYYFVLDIDDSANEARWTVYDSSDNQVYQTSWYSTTSNDFGTYDLYMYTQGSENGYIDYITKNPQFNQAPQFNFSSVSPDPPLIGENVSYSAEVYDSDGSVDYTNLTLSYGGSTVVSDEQRTGTTPSWNDVFTPQTGNKWLNATLEVVDDKGAVTTTEINRYLSDDAPSISLNDPQGSDYFTYDVPLEVEASDSDSKPDEVYSCTVDKNTSQSTVASFELYENGSTTYSDVVRSDLGSHNLTVTCSDGAGNTDSVSQAYEVKAFEVVDTVFSGSVLETEENIYSVEYRTGDMVSSADVNLSYGQDRVEENGVNTSGTGVVQTDFVYRPRLVDGSSDLRSFNFGFLLDRETVDGTSVSDERSTSNLSQTVNQGFSTDGISLDLDYGQSSNTLERHPFTADLGVSDSGLSTEDVTLSAESIFQGVAKEGFTSEFVTDSVSGSESFDVSGELFVDFKGERKTRSYSNSSLTVDEVVLNSQSNGQEVLQLDFYQEGNQSNPVTADYEMNFDVTTSAGILDKNFGFSGSRQSTSLYLEPSYAEIYASGPILYDAGNYRSREYRVYNQSLGGGVLQQNLYLIDSTVGEPVYFEVVDQAGDPVPGILEILRYDGSSGELTAISRRTIDENGQALEYLNIDDAYYGYRIIQEGEVIREFDESIITCSTVPCEELLQIDEGQLPYYSERQGFQYSCEPTQNDAGNFTGFSCDVAHEDDLMDSASLTVEKSRGLGSEVVCETNTSTPGTLVCDVEDYEGFEVSYSLEGSTAAYSYNLDSGTLDFSSNIFEDDSPLLALVVFLSVSLLGLRNYGAAILFSVAGVVVSFGFGLLSVSVASVGGLIVVGLFYLLLNKQSTGRY